MFALAILSYLVAFAIFIIVVIDAFRDEAWKGILSLLCGFYWLWYAAIEWDHDQKWLLLLVYLLALVGGAFFLARAGF